MVPNKQGQGRGIRASNQATIRIDGEQDDAADSLCFSTGITALGLFMEQSQ